MLTLSYWAQERLLYGIQSYVQTIIAHNDLQGEQGPPGEAGERGIRVSIYFFQTKIESELARVVLISYQIVPR